MKKKILIHVADDHQILIEGIVAVVNTDKDISVEGYSLTGQQVIDWYSNKDNIADVLILDITMPVIDGFQVLKYFQDNKIEQKVIVLSSYDDLRIVQEVLSLGCKGYISKNNASEHILRAIKAVANGEQYFSSDIQAVMVKSLTGQDVEQGHMPNDFLINSLTERELEVLKLITKQYSSMQIADRLCLSVNTIETYRKRLLKKINVKNAVGLAMYAVKNNIV
jgi:DNA-binding NarL/FixJ family response regulator